MWGERVDHTKSKRVGDRYREHRANQPLPTKEERRTKRVAKKLARVEKKKPRRPTQTQAPSQPKKGISYAEYLESPWWKFKRRQKLDSVKNRCGRCGEKATQVHHKHYRSLGREKHSDLEAICRPCHEREHEGLIQARAHLDSIARQE